MKFLLNSWYSFLRVNNKFFIYEFWKNFTLRLSQNFWVKIHLKAPNKIFHYKLSNKISSKRILKNFNFKACLKSDWSLWVNRADPLNSNDLRVKFPQICLECSKYLEFLQTRFLIFWYDYSEFWEILLRFFFVKTKFDEEKIVLMYAITKGSADSFLLYKYLGCKCTSLN